MNNDVIRVYPHITQYTVYITDNYTGNSIFKTNVTETRFTFNVSNDDVCPMYQVSAWNAGGEGGLSEPVQDHTSGNKDKNSNPRNQPRFLISFHQLSLLYYYHMQFLTV